MNDQIKGKSLSLITAKKTRTKRERKRKKMEILGR